MLYTKRRAAVSLEPCSLRRLFSESTSKKATDFLYMPHHTSGTRLTPLTPHRSRLQLHSDGDAVHGDQHLDRLRLIFDGCEEVERLIAVGRARSHYSSAHPLLHVGSHCARREGTERCGQPGIMCRFAFRLAWAAAGKRRANHGEATQAPV